MNIEYDLQLYAINLNLAAYLFFTSSTGKAD